MIKELESKKVPILVLRFVMQHGDDAYSFEGLDEQGDLVKFMVDEELAVDILEALELIGPTEFLIWNHLCLVVQRNPEEV